MISPPISHVVAHGIIVCNCSNQTVLLLPILGGNVKCEYCGRRYQCARMNYAVVNGQGVLEIVTEEIPEIPQGNILLDLNPRRMS